ncbi:MAG: protein kinase [Pirellulaceae bacterium]|nr:protein kinase [Pirellulaceae bacterium]
MEVGPKEDRNANQDRPTARQFRDYQVIDELGRGGMGVVYRAYDPAGKQRVALKALLHVDPTTLARFKHEFRTLADVIHPNLVRLYELVSEGDSWFFSMELIEGIDFLQYVTFGFEPIARTKREDDESTREFQPPPTLADGLSDAQLDRLVLALRQLANAVATLHAHGIVHRDIKPTNVMVTRDDRVVLLDLGLAADLDESGTHRTAHQTISGTVAYMSPEQAARQPVSSASDWYAVGTLLYQSLTGQLPFSGNEIEVLHKKQSVDPPAPSERVAEVREDLDDLCMALLNRTPNDRPDAARVLQALGKAGELSYSLAAIPQAERHTFVGRERYLEKFRDAYHAMHDGIPQTVMVSGCSGVGKSALVEAWIHEVSRDSVVLTGRCYEQESVPFKALDGFVDSLATYLMGLRRGEAETLMPRNVQALVRVFPVMGQVKAVASAPRRQIDMLDQKELQRHAISALRELLSRLGDRRSLIVYIDDLQWGDVDSASMLIDMLQPPDSPLLLFVGTYRSEDSATSSFLNAFRSIRRQRDTISAMFELEVTPLDLTESTALALNLLSRNDELSRRQAETIAIEAAGNPFFLAELVRHVTHQVGNVDSPPTQEGMSLDSVLWSRITRLPPESRHLLESVTVCGQPIAIHDACRAARIVEQETTALTELRTERFIRTVAGVELENVLITTYHDRVRESVSANLLPAELRQHHLQLAEVFEKKIVDLEKGNLEAQSNGPEQRTVISAYFDVAYHFDAADQSERALPYALQAAAHASSQHSLSVASQHYKIARRGAGAEDTAVRFEINKSLGEILMLQGDYDGGEEALSASALLAGTPHQQADIEGHMGELAHKRGDMATAAECIERALKLLGRSVPRRTRRLVPALVWELMVQTLHTLFPKLFLNKRSLVGDETDFIAIEALRRLSYAYWFSRGTLPSLWAHLRGMNLAEEYPETLELAHAYANHGPAMCTIPWYGRAHKYAAKSLQIRERREDMWGRAHSLSFHGVVLYADSRFAECIDKSREAIRLFERCGDYWEITTARYEIALSLYRLGDLRGAVEEAERTRQIGLELGDQQASGMPLDVIVRASLGQVSAEIVQSEVDRDRKDPQTESQVLLAEGVRLLYARELKQGVSALQMAYQVATKAGIRHAWVAAILPWLATALRMSAEGTRDASPALRRRSVMQAKRTSRKALRMAGSFRNELPHALRECAFVAAMDGKPLRARRLFDRSLAVAENQQARYEQAQTLRARAAIGADAGWPEVSEDTEKANQLLARILA